VRVSGEAAGVNEMSDGTRDQLFLSLRLAYIENHCSMNAPCPVILDDVLMAFDDERAGAALKVLQTLSQKTQVLVLTHHAHHVKLASSILGSTGFQLHEIAPSSAAAQTARLQIGARLGVKQWPYPSAGKSEHAFDEADLFGDIATDVFHLASAIGRALPARVLAAFERINATRHTRTLSTEIVSTRRDN
jgi:hypothetical protein